MRVGELRSECLDESFVDSYASSNKNKSCMRVVDS